MVSILPHVTYAVRGLFEFPATLIAPCGRVQPMNASGAHRRARITLPTMTFRIPPSSPDVHGYLSRGCATTLRALHPYHKPVPLRAHAPRAPLRPNWTQLSRSPRCSSYRTRPYPSFAGCTVKPRVHTETCCCPSAVLKRILILEHLSFRRRAHRRNVVTALAYQHYTVQTDRLGSPS